MAFEPWSEIEPASGDPAGSLWDYIQKFRRQVRERVASVFPDFSTATDRLTIQNLYLDVTNGLSIKDSTGATEFAKLTKDGYARFYRPYTASLFLASVSSGTPGAGSHLFGGTPTEIFDPIGFHAGANPWRFTVPASEGGTYKLTLGCKFLQSAGTLNFPHSVSIYKNAVALDAISFTVTDTYATSRWFSPVVTLAAGDYLEPYYSAYGGYTYTITNGYFTIERIG